MVLWKGMILGSWVLLGCSGSPRDEFIGTWKPTAGTTTLTCNAAGGDSGAPGLPPMDGAITRALPNANTDTWVAGPNGTVVLTNEFGSLTATVNGGTATLSSSPGLWLEGFPGTGTVSEPSNLPSGSLSGNVALTTYTFAIDSNSREATETYAGTVYIAEYGTACALVESASYQKITD